MNTLRPQTLNKIVGQDSVKKRLKIILDSSQKRGDTLPHVLLEGPPGTGKTTLAIALANEMKKSIEIANGANCRQIKKIIPYIIRTSYGSVLFIDEIHRLTKIVEEILYSVMEDFRLDLQIDDVSSLNFDKFTIIGATTESGLLSAPFRDRFAIYEYLELYNNRDIKTIISRNAKLFKLSMDDDSLMRLAKASRGTPRIANNLLKFLRDFSLSRDIQTITSKEVGDCLKLQEITDEGFNILDKKYLTILEHAFRGGPVSLDTISKILNLSRETITQQIEPFLLRMNKIEITNKGRISK